ncbi:MAG TPA: DUF4131 domain-containing protein, partial [Candidatus Paceibacterota bacterium]|nr:DUF4131 domain-containing protein [Candidatus Paceibacterota bacterium]
MEDSVFFGVAGAFFAGIFFRSYIEISVTLLAAFIGALIVAAIFFRSRRPVFVGCAVGLSFCFGSLRTHVALSGAHSLDPSVGASISLDGSICSDPKTAGFSTSFCFSPKGSSDRIMVRISRGRNIFFGDDVGITGVLEFPKSDPSFDYRSYLLKDDVRYVMQKAKVLKSGTNSGNPIVTTFLNMKHVILRQIDVLLEKPYAGILEGMLLGDRSAISA